MSGQEYYGTKRVTAWPETRVVPKVSGSAIDGEESVKGYAVRYADGYTSWSPKDVFEAAYQPLNALSFGHALQALKEGHKVARAGWNGKGMWLALIPDDQWGLGSGQPYDSGAVGSGFLPWIGMKTVDGKFVPWLASQTDLLANDWGIV